MSGKLRAGVVGMGSWGRSHALAYSDHPDVELVAVCDLDEQRARRVAQEFEALAVTSVEALLDVGIDLVSIATPDRAHHAPAAAALSAGTATLIEKPLTTDTASARDLVERASASGAIATVDFHSRFHPTFMEIKDAIEAGQLGEPTHGYIRLSDAIRFATGALSWANNSGPEWFLLPHIMDLARWWFAQEPIAVYARERRGRLETEGVNARDLVIAMVEFEDAIVTFESSWIVPDSTPSLIDTHVTLYGTDGRIEYDQDADGFSLAAKEGYRTVGALGTERDRHGQLSSFIYRPIFDFIERVREKEQPEITLDDGLVITRLIEATIRSIETGQRVVLDRT